MFLSQGQPPGRAAGPAAGVTSRLPRVTSTEQLAAVRADYDDKAEAYTAFIGEAFGGQPLNHVMVGAFADLVRQAGGGQSGGGLVADVGCGPGHVTAYLRDRSVDAFGVDLSPRLVAAAREANPGVRFDVGDMNDLGALGIGTGSLAGVLANYSVIHTPPDALPATLAELARVLAPGGHLLVSFQALDAAPGEDPARGFPQAHLLGRRAA